MATFEKVINFRQVGGVGLTNKNGKKVKEKVLYRSARLDSATSGDKGVLVEQLKLKSIVDLRGMFDYAKRTKKPMEEFYTPISIKNGLAKEISRPKSSQVGFLYIVDMLTKRYFLHLMNQVNVFIRIFSWLLFPFDVIFGTCLFTRFYGKRVVNKMEQWEHYVDVLEFSKPEVAEVLRLVSDPINLPMLIHCELGKDRTGYMTALILSCLLIEEDVIVKDYAETEQEIKSILNHVIATIDNKFGVDERFAHADARTMQLMLAELTKRYGSVNEYITSTGFTKQEQEKLRECLLEEEN